jgi:hypothetical protein
MMAEMMEREEMSCPMATQDITLNLKNRGKAIDAANYGPENPALPNTGYWREMASQWDVTPKEAKMSRCGNCAAFNRSPEMVQCIAKGLGPEGDPWATIEAGDLGYCEIFDFKCAASRTCQAWIAKEEDEEEEYEEEEGEGEEGDMEGDEYED